MTIDITNKEVSKLRRLRIALASGIVPVKDVQELVDGLQRKCDPAAAGTGGVRPRGVKSARKERLRNSLKIAS